MSTKLANLIPFLCTEKKKLTSYCICTVALNPDTRNAPFYLSKILATKEEKNKQSPVQNTVELLVWADGNDAMLGLQNTGRESGF